jgi:hypothetical protein
LIINYFAATSINPNRAQPKLKRNLHESKISNDRAYVLDGAELSEHFNGNKILIDA